MKPKTAAILRHLVDAFLVISLASSVICLAFWTVSTYSHEALIWLSNADLSLPVIFTILSILFGWAFPEKMMSFARALKLWPRHWGLIIRTSLGCILTLALVHYFNLVEINRAMLLNLGFRFFIAQLSIFFSGIAIANLHLKLNEIIKNATNNKSGSDEPIYSIDENRFSEHEVTARRILLRLKSGKLADEKNPNIALIGPYGSGKTSICNLVEYIHNDESSKAECNNLLFCRFEAWQYLTTDGAVKGLIDLIVGKVEEYVDCSGLESIPDRYLDALKACPSRWTDLFTSLLRKRQDSDDIVKSIQNVLLRIGKRIVVFVDDFDRLESKSEETQHAIAASLNQLQNLSNVQYILCVGPMRDGTGADLLKLTRFQELMPQVETDDIRKSIKKIRDDAIREESNLFCPWSLEKDDQLQYSLDGIPFNTTLIFQLVELIKTPRELKSLECETQKIWNDGLKGEISWYDLLLMNMLKISEPGVFEWVMRDPEVFLEGTIGTGTPNEEESKEAVNEIEKKLKEALETKTKQRMEIVRQILLDLFPEFMKGMGGLAQNLSRSEPFPWEQRISSAPNNGKSYFRRYFSGEVPKGEVHDQPTLQYIQKITKNGFVKEEFQELYLYTYEKLTNDLNRFVWFSELLTQELARDVCDCILEWLCDRNHWRVWDPMEGHALSVMNNVKKIVDQSGNFELTEERRTDMTMEDIIIQQQWVDETIDKLFEKDIVVAIYFAGVISHYKLTNPEVKQRELLPFMGSKLKDIFVNDKEFFWKDTIGHREYFSKIVGFLRGYKDYEAIREEFTKGVVERAEVDKTDEFVGGIMLTLVHHHADKFFITKERNYEIYNMDTMLPLILRWENRKFKDPFLAKAYECLSKEYSEELECLKEHQAKGSGKIKATVIKIKHIIQNSSILFWPPSHLKSSTFSACTLLRRSFLFCRL
ncbi:MAG: P-loop NTPase fold protein [Candidatus Scalindua sp.]